MRGLWPRLWLEVSREEATPRVTTVDPPGCVGGFGVGATGSVRVFSPDTIPDTDADHGHGSGAVEEHEEDAGDPMQLGTPFKPLFVSDEASSSSGLSDDEAVHRLPVPPSHDRKPKPFSGGELVSGRLLSSLRAGPHQAQGRESGREATG